MGDIHKAAPYTHWMLREIHEQPASIASTLDRYVDGSEFRPETCSAIFDWLERADGRIVITASGSSRHAGLFAESVIEDLSGIAVDVEYASEHSCRSRKSTMDSSVIVVSQSGETADTLAALRQANRLGRETLAITNVVSSSMDQESKVSFPTVAGVERSIPATKSFTAQLVNLYLLALMSARVQGTLAADALSHRLSDASQLPTHIQTQLHGWQNVTHAMAQEYGKARNFLYLGRGLHYAIAREGALKLKESAYLHAEGYPSGELKHGPNALVDEGTPLVMLATVDRSDPDSILRYEKVVHLMRDMRAQHATILAIANVDDDLIASLADHTVFVTEMREPLLAICEVIPLQLFSYWMAVNNGIDLDHPRNLTKAVLAE